MAYPKTIIITAVPSRTGTDLLCRRANLQQSFKPNLLGERTKTVNIISMHPKKPLTVLNEQSSFLPPRKRQRLDHLTMEEKIMRRKLKNRVAAQSARDRKKMKMEELEVVVQQLESEKAELEEENARLKNMNMLLETENQFLKASSPAQVQTKQEQTSDLKGEMKSGASLEHAEGTGAPSSFSLDDAIRLLTDDNESDFFKFLEKHGEDLLESGSLPENYNQPAGQTGSQEAGPSAEMVGTTTEDLESIKELIHFDHVYYKEEEEEDSSLLKLPQQLSSVPQVVINSPHSPVIVDTVPENVAHTETISSSLYPTHEESKALLSPCGSCNSEESGYDSATSPFSMQSIPGFLDSLEWEDPLSELFPALV